MPERICHLSSVRGYYDTSSDSGASYRDFYAGNCHFGFTPEGSNGSYDMPEAQRNMRLQVGEALGLPKGSAVLDAGCGFGPLARTLSEEFGHKVTGIDLMSERLVHANALNNGNGVAGSSYSEGDYHALPFAGGSFNGVCTLETFVHANPLEEVLGEFNRVLKPGGRIALFEYSIPDLDTVTPVVRNVAERVISRTAMTSLPRLVHGSYPKFLKDSGFENIQVRDISKNVWPTWRHLWHRAAKNTAESVLDRSFCLDNIQGTALIYPARHQLRYNIVTANKPN
ncbi:class I SAM-dependent methyltransferase [Patescibacteria group bacterium]